MTRPLGLGHPAGQEEEGRAWLPGGWAFMHTAGFLGWVSRERPLKTPGEGWLPVTMVLQVSSVLPTTPGILGL